MAASWASNSNKIHAKNVSRDRFPGIRKTSKHVQQSTTTIPLWLHHGTEGLPYGKVSSATSAVCQGCSQPASSNTMHSFVFFHDRLYEYGYCVTMETQETQHQSLSTEATQKSCEVIMQKRSCLCSCPLDVIHLYIFVYSYIDVHQCISASESLWKHKGRSLLSNSSGSSHQSSGMQVSFAWN